MTTMVVIEGPNEYVHDVNHPNRVNQMGPNKR